MVGFLKVGYLLVERAAEPLSARLEAAAARSGAFRSSCVLLATWVNGIEHRRQLRRVARLASEGEARGEREGGEGGKVGVTPAPQLNEEQAVEAGCRLIGEGFVVVVGFVLLLHQARALSSRLVRTGLYSSQGKS